MKSFYVCVIVFLYCCFCSVKLFAGIPVYVWQGWDEHTTEKTLKRDFAKWKRHGVSGVCMNTGFDVEKARVASVVAKSFGLEFHAWAPCMLQENLNPEWYAVNRLGESAFDKQAYVPYYKCLDPRNPEVIGWLKEQCARLAEIPDVDYVQLDYIRYADVILAKGLWQKYGLIMDTEYPVADYCYCDRCVNDFKRLFGIDIKKIVDPSSCREWAQFRCDAITDLVNQLAEVVHEKGKKISADVFPGPDSYAKWMVRQEWSKWNVDVLFPMNYNDFYLKTADWLKEIVKEEVEAVNGKKNIYSGLFICHDWQNKHKVTDPENSGLLPSELREAVLGSIESGAKGVCLFTATSMTEEHWKMLYEIIQGH